MLLREHGWQVIADPEFTEPGKAIYHCPRIITKGKPEVSEEYSEVTAWDMTPLPAENASQIAARLRKGCLFQQPHIDSVKFVGLQLKDIDPNLNKGPGPELKFHHQIGPNVYNFQTWGGYVNFMNHRKLVITEADYPPERRDELLEQYKDGWVCWQHNLGFNNPHLAQQHRRESIRQPGRATHTTLDEMNLSAGHTNGPERGQKENINA